MKIILFLGFCFTPLFVVAIKPIKEYVQVPNDLILKYVEANVKTSDGATIDIWHLQPEIANGKSIVLAYGDFGNKSYWLNHAAMLVQFGFDVVLFDYRGFGASSNFEIDSNALYYNEFARDLSAVFNWTETTLPKNKHYLWALSMGTIIGMKAITDGEILPEKVIVEGLVVQPNALREKLKLSAPSDCADLEVKIASSEMKFLVFAGKKDMQTSLESATLFVNANKRNRKLAVFDGTHLQGFQKLTANWFGDEYIKAILDFIQ